MYKLSLTLLLFFSFVSSSQAVELSPFQATFNVKIFGMTLGEVKQSLSCDYLQPRRNCLLTSTAIPPSWAERFINESAIEKIWFTQTSSTLNWQKYQKYLTRRYDDRTEKKIITFIKKPETNQIIFIEKDKAWPLQTKVFDEISVIYALQHALLNKQPLNGFYVQGDKEQRAISTRIKSTHKEIDLPFGDDVETTLIEFENSKIVAKIWFINIDRYFPGRIEITDKKEDRTVTLELQELPARS